MLRFTAAGVVSTPTTVQIRVTRTLPGRLAAGAPVPERTLSDDEVEANLHHFVVGLRGPRTRACTALVLSGVQLQARHGLAQVVRRARSWGLQRVTLHLGRDERLALRRTPLAECLDDLAIVVRDELDLGDVAALGRQGLAVTAVLPLDQAGLARLQGTASALARIRPRRVVLTWPLDGELPPHAARVAPLLPAPVEQLEQAGVSVLIKGLPLCALGPLARLGGRTRNRWYVDAAHQLDQALLFFPDVLRFAKEDGCRWCSLEPECDGAPARWLAARRTGPLHPRPAD